MLIANISTEHGGDADERDCEPEEALGWIGGDFGEERSVIIIV